MEHFEKQLSAVIHEIHMICLKQVQFSLQKSLFNVKKYGAGVEGPGTLNFYIPPRSFAFSNLNATSKSMHNRINSFVISCASKTSLNRRRLGPLK